MASLGRLTIDLVANMGGFETDLSRASRTTQREMNKVNRSLRFAQRDADKAAARIRNLGLQMAAVAGIGLGLVVREFRNLSQQADRIQKLAISTGLTAEAVQELGFAAEQSGSDMESLVRGVQQLQRNIQGGLDGLTTYSRAFSRIGIEVQELAGLRPDEQFRRVAQALSEIEDPTIRTATAMEVFGRAGRDLLPLLNRGSAGIEQFAEQMRRSGAVMSQDTVDAAARFNDALNLLQKNIQGLKVSLFSDMIEPLSNVAEFLAHTERGAEAFGQILSTLKNTLIAVTAIITTRFIVSLGVAIGQFVIAQREVARLTAAKAALGATSAATSVSMRALGAAVSVALGPIGIAIAIIGTLALSSRGLVGDLKNAASGADNFGREAETTAERVARLTGNMERLTEIQRRNAFEEMRQDALELRRAIVELDREIQKRVQEQESSGFLDPFLVDAQADRESMLAELNLIVDGLNEINSAGRSAGEGVSDGMNDAAAAISIASDEGERFLRQMEDLADTLEGGNARALRSYTRQIAEATRLFQSGRISVRDYAIAMNLLTRELNDATAVAGTGGFTFGIDFDFILSALGEVSDKMHEIAAIEWGFENLIDSFNPLAAAMRRLGDEIELIDLTLNKGLISNAEAGFWKMGAAANATFGAMMQGVDRTSKEYKQLERAQQIVNVAMGIAAILQQGMGDPYTAIPRMVAMAAMVASLGVKTGGIGGGSAAGRQDRQGTGTVLGDADAKSESIINAIEITADATSKLVGINRGMLHSLQQLQRGLGGAAGMVARGAGDIDLSGISVGMSGLESVFKTLDPLGHAFDSLIGGLFGFGKTKITDEGIALIGGLISDMTEGAVAMAFADLKRKSLLGSRSRTVMEDLDDAFNTQLNLIFGSMIDTVTAAGQALGIPLDELEARIASFEVQALEISLKDLSAEEQQAELEAVFSAIFDDFASHVIPFIGQFQKIGEGMGEAMIRVATSVQVAQESIRRLGLSIDEGLSPERMAQVSVGLMEAAGGIEQFISQMESFVNNFAPEAHKFEVAQSDVTRALEQMGIELPNARDGFWGLMQALDPMTEEGQQAIATLLGISEAAHAYYSMLEKARESYAQAATAAHEFVAMHGLSDFQAEMVSIQRELIQSTDAMNKAARAAGLQSAREEDLAAAHERAAIRAVQAIARLEQSGRDLVGQIFGTALDDINRQIDELREIESASATASGALQSFGQSLIAFADSLLIGSLSPLTSGERLDEAMTQLLAASAAGDASAVQSLSQQVLQIGQSRFGSGQPFTDLFDEVQGIIRGTVVDDTQNVSVVSAPGISLAMRELLKEQSELEAQEAERQRSLLGKDLAQIVADLAQSTGDSFLEVADRLGFDLAELGDLLGLDEDELLKFIEGLKVDTDELATFLESLQDSIVDAITTGFEGTSRREPREAPPHDPDPPEGRRQIRESVDNTTTAVSAGSDQIVGAISGGNSEVIALLRRIADTMETQPRNERVN